MTADGQSLYVLNRDQGALIVLDLTTNRELRRVPLPEAIGRVSVSPDGKWIACGGGLHPRIMVLDGQSYDVVREIPLGWRTASRFSPDGRWFVTVDRYHARVWDTTTWQERSSVERGQHAPYHRGSIAFAPDGRLAAIAATSSTVRLVRIPDLAELAVLESPDEQTTSWLEFGPSGNRLAVGVEEAAVHLWRIDLLRAELSALDLDWEL